MKRGRIQVRARHRRAGDGRAHELEAHRVVGGVHCALVQAVGIDIARSQQRQRLHRGARHRAGIATRHGGALIVNGAPVVGYRDDLLGELRPGREGHGHGGSAHVRRALRAGLSTVGQLGADVARRHRRALTADAVGRAQVRTGVDRLVVGDRELRRSRRRLRHRDDVGVDRRPARGRRLRLGGRLILDRRRLGSVIEGADRPEGGKRPHRRAHRSPGGKAHLDLAPTLRPARRVTRDDAAVVRVHGGHTGESRRRGARVEPEVRRRRRVPAVRRPRARNHLVKVIDDGARTPVTVGIDPEGGEHRPRVTSRLHGGGDV